MDRETKRCYVAGALNSDAVGYIQNLHRMIINAERVRKIGYAVFVPGIDFLMGVTHGDWSYSDYFLNSQPWLDVSDCMYVTPLHEESKGTAREIIRADRKGIPIFYDLHSLKAFHLDKPVIICLIGESGAGKSLTADHISEKYGYHLIQSRTTREPRTPDESGHMFVSDDEFDTYNKEDMLAFTEFGGNRYCCLKQDVGDKNIYVIDEYGLCYLRSRFSDLYHIVSIRLDRQEVLRREDVGEERIERDKGMFNLPGQSFDHIIFNNKTIKHLFEEVDYCMNPKNQLL